MTPKQQLRAEFSAGILNSLLIRNAIQSIEQDQSALIAESRSLAESLLKDLEQSLADRRWNNWNDWEPSSYKFCWVMISCDGNLISAHGPLECIHPWGEWYERRQPSTSKYPGIPPAPRRPIISPKNYQEQGRKLWWLPEDRFSSIEQARDAFLDFLLFA